MIFNDTIVVLAADGPPGLFPAREQMAVSLEWHIILACFGVTFPMMIFVMYRRAIRRNDRTALGVWQSGRLVCAGVQAQHVPDEYAPAVVAATSIEQQPSLPESGGASH